MNNRYMLMAGCLSLVMNTACFKQLEMEEQTPPIQLEVEQNMAGKWFVFSRDAQPVPTNEKHVVTYVAGWSSYRSLSHPSYAMNWMEKTPFSCTVYGNEISEKSGNVEYKTSVKNITPTEMEAEVNFKDGGNHTETHRYVFRKTEQEYMQSILGLWEGKLNMAGIPDENDHRWEFRADGSFLYYNWNLLKEEWVVNADKSSRYVVDGNWLAMMRVDSVGAEVRECWDVTVERNQMYWIALREDSLGGKINEQKQLMRIR